METPPWISSTTSKSVFFNLLLSAPEARSLKDSITETLAWKRVESWREKTTISLELTLLNKEDALKILPLFSSAGFMETTIRFLFWRELTAISSVAASIFPERLSPVGVVISYLYSMSLEVRSYRRPSRALGFNE